jgi:hypothetical protein
MFPKNFTNADIARIDWAKGNRTALLLTLHSDKAESSASSVSSGWGTDVAGSDKRSVHAYLAGKGDLRTAWWNLYSRVYQTVVAGADLERAMYSFHRTHHALTLSKLSYLVEVSVTAADLKRDGVIAAVRKCAVAPGRWR